MYNQHGFSIVFFFLVLNYNTSGIYDEFPTGHIFGPTNEIHTYSRQIPSGIRKKIPEILTTKIFCYSRNKKFWRILDEYFPLGNFKTYQTHLLSHLLPLSIQSQTPLSRHSLPKLTPSHKIISKSCNFSF